MGSINWFENGVQVFYPNAYHLVAALVLRLTGVDVPTVLNAHTVLLPGMGALAIVALVHRFGGRAVLAVAAAACSVAVTSFYDMLWRGPAAAVRHRRGADAAGRGAAAGPAGRRPGRRARLRTGLLFAVAWSG